MPRRLYLFIPGIYQNPAGRDDWSDRACEWIEDYTPDVARDYEYRSRALTRFIGQGARVDACRDILNAYADHERVVVCHSNGCAVALDLLKETRGLKLHSLHLIAAAAPAHCGVNGLNGVAGRRQVGRVHLYGSESDGALWWGGLSRTLFGWCGLGYGDLGRSRPCNMTPELKAITEIDWRKGWGHCDWFTRGNFTNTMRLVTR